MSPSPDKAKVLYAVQEPAAVSLFGRPSARYGDPHALQVARDLDAKVEGLLYEAAGLAPNATTP